jgi:type III secretion protein T
LTGQQTTLIGSYLARLAACLFAAFGGLHLFVDLLLSSFQVWPVLAPLPDLPAAGRLLFVQRFDELMRLMLILAAPALTLLTLIEIGLGFVNRYASQLNVMTLSMALKGWIAAFVLLLTIGSAVDFMADWLSAQREVLKLLPFGGGPFGSGSP